MFNDLDATLKALLTSVDAPAPVRNADITFDAPDKDYKPAQTTVNLFLHEISENRSLRDPTSHVVRSGQLLQADAPLLRVDCGYLVTAWSTKSGGVKIAEEHQLLALALLWIARFAVLDQSLLQGSLQTPPQPYPVISSVAQTQEGENAGHFWSALGVAPRAGFSLTVTLTLQPFDEIVEYPAVETVVIDPNLISPSP